MKFKVFLFAAMAVLLASCSKSPKEKALAAIKESLSKTLNDFSSYEPVETGEPDSTFTTFKEDSVGESLRTKAERFERNASEALTSAQMKIYMNDMPAAEVSKKTAQEMSDSAVLCYKKIGEMKKTFVPKFDGWKVSHSYRAKNKMGALVLNKEVFFLSPDLSTIVTSSRY